MAIKKKTDTNNKFCLDSVKYTPFKLKNAHIKKSKLLTPTMIPLVNPWSALNTIKEYAMT
ncbi:hypothetical protein THO17_01460 [Marinomonas sp. THO17]